MYRNKQSSLYGKRRRFRFSFQEGGNVPAPVEEPKEEPREEPREEPKKVVEDVRKEEPKEDQKDEVPDVRAAQREEKDKKEGESVVTDLPKKTQKFYDRIKDQAIVRMTVVRAPIQRVVSKALNVMSLGLFNKVLKKLGYDEAFHLSVRVETKQGVYRLEKNQNILVSNYKKEPNEEEVNIPIRKNITIMDLMNRAFKKVGPSRFYKYDAFNQAGGGNCQRFIMDLLNSSGLLSPPAKKFIDQDAEQILKSLPNVGIDKAARKITDTAAALEKVRQLLPFKKGGIIDEEDGCICGSADECGCE
jgi:hypothetical protein